LAAGALPEGPQPKTHSPATVIESNHTTRWEHFAFIGVA